MPFRDVSEQRGANPKSYHWTALPEVKIRVTRDLRWTAGHGFVSNLGANNQDMELSTRPAPIWLSPIIRASR